MSASWRAQLVAVRDVVAPRRMCRKKNRYETQRLAKKVIVERRASGWPTELYAYRCPECRGWHITRMEQPS